MTGKNDVSVQTFAESLIRRTTRGSILIPDTGFVSTTIQPFFWKAAAERSLGFSQATVAELSGWLSDPHHNKYLDSWLPRSLRECEAAELPVQSLFRSTRVMGPVGNVLADFTVAVAERSRFQQFGYDYYVNMLSLRKRLGIAAYSELQDRLGREPSEPELKCHLNNEYHARVSSLAFKGWKDREKRNYLADEELVVTAVMTAVVTGRDTIILTRDTDVFDQFAKLIELLVADYWCHRFADVRYLNPVGCPMYPMKFPPELGEEYGLLGDSFEHVVVPQEEVDALPPYRASRVNAYCFLLGNSCLDPKISEAGVCLEREMGHLLVVKGLTGGKNSKHFGDKNMILGMKADDGKVGVLFILGTESYTEYEGVKVSCNDLRRGLSSDILVIKKYFQPSIVTNSD